MEGNHGKGAAAGPNLPATVEPLQVKEEEQEEEEEEEEKEKNSENFSSVVRTELSREYKKRASVIGLEVRILFTVYLMYANSQLYVLEC